LAAIGMVARAMAALEFGLLGHFIYSSKFI